MTFRLRVALALAAGAIIPLLLLAAGVRREMTLRLSRQAEARIHEEIASARRQLELESQEIARALERLSNQLREENRFRLAVASGDLDAGWLRDWAEPMATQSGLDVLELVDASGQILSSGHFRNQFGQVHPGLASAIEQNSSQITVGRFRTPGQSIDALSRSQAFEVAGRRFMLIGGTRFNPDRLLPETAQLTVTALTPEDVLSGGEETMAEIALALIVPGDSTTVIPSKLLFTRDLTPLIALRRGVDRWFLAAGALAILLTLILSFMLAARVTRPLAELTEKTSRVDLDRPDVTFDSGRSDEIGSLARVLDAMTARMQVGAQRLREAERRATTGDLARQINHDVKNGLAPIRHVLRHLAEVARNQPDELAHVFRDRQGTLESSVEYLENLSRNYARLTPAIDRGQADPNHLLREVARSLSIAPERVEVKLAPTLPPVRADAVALRRIIENLSGNAVDAVRDQGGTITLQSEVAGADGNVVVRLLVADTGPGMSRDQLERAFDDFFTTKDGGTGLGLSVVRRLVADLGGTLRVETEPGQGSRFIVDLPAAGPA